MSVRVATSSHIVEMIKELVQPEGLEVPATGTISEGTTTVTREPCLGAAHRRIYHLRILSLVKE